MAMVGKSYGDKYKITGRGGMVWSLGLAIIQLYTGWINNKVLLYSTGDYSQYLVIKP